MSDVASSSFVREVLVPERPAPVKTTGFIGFVRTRLLNSPTNILLTVLGTLLIWFTVIPALKIPAGRRRLARQRSHRLPFGNRRPPRRRVLALYRGKVRSARLWLLP